MAARKWLWLSGIGVVVVVAALLAWQFFVRHQESPTSDCQVARAMIDYNKSQGRLLAKAFDPEHGAEASVDDYQAWANQLQNDAGRIKAPDLATHARRLADDANQMVALVKKTRSDTSAPADPGAPPAWVQPYAELSKRFRSELVALDSACPR
jgi:hypothetical protein